MITKLNCELIRDLSKINFVEIIFMIPEVNSWQITEKDSYGKRSTPKTDFQMNQAKYTFSKACSQKKLINYILVKKIVP